MGTKLSFASAVALAVAVPSPGPAAARAYRPLPAGYQWGRCLLEVDGRTYLSGRCSYLIDPGGSFEMHGSRQNWARFSSDWWAVVNIADGYVAGSWNAHPEHTYANEPLGFFTRRGGCWVNARARICLWRR